MLIRFSHVMVYSQRQAEAVRWYCEKLGYEIDYNAPVEYTSLHHKLLGRLAVHATTSPTSIGRGPMPYLLCDDIVDTLQDLRKKGVVTSDPIREGESPQFADFQDLDGNIWGIEET